MRKRNKLTNRNYEQEEAEYNADYAAYEEAIAAYEASITPKPSKSKKSKEFTLEKYEEIKTLLKDNKISSKDIENYIKLKNMRYERYQEKNNYTDEEMLSIINNKEIENKKEKEDKKNDI